MYNHAAVHVTTRLTWSELTRLTTLVSKIMLLNRVKHGSLGVKTSNASPISCGSRSSHFYFSLKYVRWLYVPSEVHVTTYSYFFASSRMKKAFKLARRASYIVVCPLTGHMSYTTSLNAVFSFFSKDVSIL